MENFSDESWQTTIDSRKFWLFTISNQMHPISWLDICDVSKKFVILEQVPFHVMRNRQSVFQLLFTHLLKCRTNIGSGSFAHVHVLQLTSLHRNVSRNGNLKTVVSQQFILLHLLKCSVKSILTHATRVDLLHFNQIRSCTEVQWIEAAACKESRLLSVVIVLWDEIPASDAFDAAADSHLSYLKPLEIAWRWPSFLCAIIMSYGVSGVMFWSDRSSLCPVDWSLKMTLLTQCQDTHSV
jgi:hypothetical protein